MLCPRTDARKQSLILSWSLQQILLSADWFRQEKKNKSFFADVQRSRRRRGNTMRIPSSSSWLLQVGFQSLPRGEWVAYAFPNSPAFLVFFLRKKNYCCCYDSVASANGEQQLSDTKRSLREGPPCCSFWSVFQRLREPPAGAAESKTRSCFFFFFVSTSSSSYKTSCGRRCYCPVAYYCTPVDCILFSFSWC